MAVATWRGPEQHSNRVGTERGAGVGGGVGWGHGQVAESGRGHGRATRWQGNAQTGLRKDSQAREGRKKEEGQ